LIEVETSTARMTLLMRDDEERLQSRKTETFGVTMITTMIIIMKMVMMTRLKTTATMMTSNTMMTTKIQRRKQRVF